MDVKTLRVYKHGSIGTGDCTSSAQRHVSQRTKKQAREFTNLFDFLIVSTAFNLERWQLYHREFPLVQNILAT